MGQTIFFQKWMERTHATLLTIDGVSHPPKLRDMFLTWTEELPSCHG